MIPDKNFLIRKGRINHSVCQWCYSDYSLEQLCDMAKELGIKSIDLVEPKDFSVLQAAGLDCGMVYGLPKPYGIENCFNDPKNHKQLLNIYRELIPQVSDSGFKNVICFSGNKRGLPDQFGIDYCREGLLPVLDIAEKYNVMVIMELLNSKVDHPEYQCDKTEWGINLSEKIDHPNFGLLYDIYHMQIMEGDIIATIQKHYTHFKHYHTGGVPGRNEIDSKQELNYPAIMEAIANTGFDGYVAQEFIPTRDPFASLKEAITICDI